MRYAQLDGTTVINVIELEEHTDEWDGYPVVRSDEAGPGDTYDGKTFVKPEPVPVEKETPKPTIEDILAVLPKDVQVALAKRLETPEV